MIHRYVYHNDHLVPIEQARLSPGQAGLLSGWGNSLLKALADCIRALHQFPYEGL